MCIEQSQKALCVVSFKAKVWYLKVTLVSGYLTTPDKDLCWIKTLLEMKCARSYRYSVQVFSLFFWSSTCRCFFFWMWDFVPLMSGVIFSDAGLKGWHCLLAVWSRMQYLNNYLMDCPEFLFFFFGDPVRYLNSKLIFINRNFQECWSTLTNDDASNEQNVLEDMGKQCLIGRLGQMFQC